MDKLFISDLKENEKADSIFLVKNKSLLKGKTGKDYISLKLSDKTGDIKANIWDNTQKFANIFEAGDFIRIKSKTSVFQNELQLNISDAEKIDVTSGDLCLFLRSSRFNIDDMYLELCTILRENIKDKYISELINSFLNDEHYTDKLKSLPAAKSIHHAYIGGLLEHTLSIVKAGLLMSMHYKDSVNKDVMLASCFLHDAGKIQELRFNKNIAEYSDEGRLLGHIVLGINCISKRIESIKGFPENLKIIILHSIASHHGELEFGSPKRPKTIEALILHFIDNMDARVNQFEGLTEETAKVSYWSNYSKHLDRYILDSKSYLV
ncbi:MAG: HD domain-containing protein [Candidatus Acididesulfobacter guangdongensis]|uniref:HD domain-containing protein n=1 Tax=Acididesulfobacter guangdongensis TaxID=2597225 RepID=A0A519BHL5_ACIG2|nr:MAG: HD domain-containing protein [Candidatus Acididesulfobacter guangdongensis]